MAALVPWSAMAARATSSTIGPGMGTALEVSMSLGTPPPPVLQLQHWILITSTIKSHTSQHSMSDLIVANWTHHYYSLRPTNFQPRILFTCCLVSSVVSSCFHRPVFPNGLQRKDSSPFEVWAQHHPTSSWQGNYILRYKSISTVITISSLYSPSIALLFNKHHLFALTLCVRSTYVTPLSAHVEVDSSFIVSERISGVRWRQIRHYVFTFTLCL